MIKIIVTRGSGGRGYKAPDDAAPLRIVSSHPLPEHPEHCQQGISVRLCRQRLGINPSLAGIKHLNRLEQVLARSEWDDADIREGLMLDVSDQLVEGTMSNLFLVRDGMLLTSPVTDNGIAGIMRAEIIKLAASLDIELELRGLKLNDLQQADEVFLCNSIINIWPVTSLTEPAWHWPHGMLTRRLQSALKQTDR